MLFQSDLDQSFLKFRGYLFFKLTHYDPVAIAPVLTSLSSLHPDAAKI